MTKPRTPNTLSQHLATIDNPEFTTTIGRVLDEVRITLLAIARKENPRTTLGGLILGGRFSEDPTAEGKSVGGIAATVHIDPTSTNHRGETINDTLTDLIEVGLVEEVDPQSPIDMLIDGLNVQKIRLAAGVVERATA